MPRARCAVAMTSFFARSAVQSRAGRPGGRPLRMRNKGCGKTGRCGERTERCRWLRKRSERVAAVKILSVRRKAAQKFWAPQQDHRPLRMRNKGCNGRATARVAPTEGYKECLAGGRPQGSPLRKRYKGCGKAGGVYRMCFKFVKKLSCLFGAVAVQCFRRFFASKFALHPG